MEQTNHNYDEGERTFLYIAESEALRVNVASEFENLGVQHDVALVMSQQLDSWALFPFHRWDEEIAHLRQLVDARPYVD
jgi:hypothetical protein